MPSKADFSMWTFLSPCWSAISLNSADALASLPFCEVRMRFIVAADSPVLASLLNADCTPP